MISDVDVFFRYLSYSGATLAVVTVGAEVYGVAAQEPLAALQSVAQKASASLGRRVDPNVILERGRKRLTTYASATPMALSHRSRW